MKPSLLNMWLWIGYTFSFGTLAFALVFQSVFASSPAIFTLDQTNPNYIQAGHWFEVALAIVLFVSIVFPFVVRLVRQKLKSYLLSAAYTVAIIYTAIIGPTDIVRTDYGQLTLQFFTPIPWFLVWLSVIMIWLIASRQSLTETKSHVRTSAKKRA